MSSTVDPDSTHWRGRAATLILLLVAVLGANAQGPTTTDSSKAPVLSDDIFRTERTALAGGSEIVTIFARKNGPNGDLPLVSVLRDTLGDGRPENDRLRYVWVHSYTRPSLRQKLASYLPFLYARAGNNKDIGKSPPPAVIDLNRPSGSGGWDTVFWQIFKRVMIGDAGHLAKASALQYRENKEDYRRTAIATALAALSIYEKTSKDRLLSDRELQDIQARLSLKEKPFGSHMQPENLDRAYAKQSEKQRDERAQNWELLRQACERQNLVFDPLRMPDGSARHAIVWVRAEDLAANSDRKWVGRFLNIRDPWRDKDLLHWTGYKAERWYDANDVEVGPATPGATKQTLIPLAIYGLDHPKIPAILIDFRSKANPKMREMSRRVISDFVNDFASITQIAGLPAFLAKGVFDFVTDRRGIDIDQRSRLKSYAGLKLLLQLDGSLDPDLSAVVGDRVEYATLNPLQNDFDVEEKIARTQYSNLRAWAQNENGLAAKIRNDRREEMMRLKHPGVPVRLAYSLAHFVTFGAFTHREKDTPEMMAKLDLRRQLDYHERVVREIAFRTNDPEIDANVEALKYSLIFLASKGSEANGKTTRSLAKIFRTSSDNDLRTLCIAGLYKINSENAKRELLVIYQDQQQTPQVRTETARYLKLAAEEGQRISKLDARAIASIPALN